MSQGETPGALGFTSGLEGPSTLSDGTRREVSEVLSIENFFAKPEKLDEALQRCEAAYQARLERLERRGVLAGGRLPLIASIFDQAQSIDSLPVMRWGQIADVIRRDERVRQALVALEGEGGIPLIQPDCRAASLQSLIHTPVTLNPVSGIPPMAISQDFDLEADTRRAIVPFDYEALLGIRDMEGQEGFRHLYRVLVKIALLAAGKLRRKGFLGISFMDAGRAVPSSTLDTTMFNAVFRASQQGLHVVAPETYFVAASIADQPLDQQYRTWLDCCHTPSGDALCASWGELFHSLNLYFDEPGSHDEELGFRREARVNMDGLEV
ncbi:hypothetical protein HZA43_04845 [Candidatus Peregrinibacteria bacterium]|nr:hypothetical protein [Candidatus Peregrinibacteria bacterium]